VKTLPRESFYDYTARSAKRHWKLIVVVAILAVFSFYAVMPQGLVQSVVPNNQTAAGDSLNSTTVFQDSNGNALASGSQVSGVLTAIVTIPQQAVVETATCAVSGTVPTTGTYTGTVAYYVQGVTLIIQQHGGNGVPTLTVSAVFYSQASVFDPVAWFNSWRSAMMTDYVSRQGSTSGWSDTNPVYPATPTGGFPWATYRAQIPTYGLSNGVQYDIYTVIGWNAGTTTVGAGLASTVLTLPPPPSFSTTTMTNGAYVVGGNMYLASFMLSQQGAGGGAGGGNSNWFLSPEPASFNYGLLLIPAAFVVAIFVMRRRKRSE
jgi:hypothetical protein